MAKGLIEREKELVRREKELLKRESLLLKKESDAFHKKHPVIFATMVLFAAILVWRGLWGLIDLHFFPEDVFFSYSLSLALGLAVLFITGYISKA